MLTDPDHADTARYVAGWLAGGDDVDDPAELTLAGLQQFLWYGLPLKWMTEPGDREVVVEAAARLFEVLDRPRYVALCRSALTGNILDAYDRSEAAGLRAFRAALKNSPVEPPDLADFVWGSRMGLEEACARSYVEDGLEAALKDGRFEAGVGMWRATRARVTAGLLDTERPGYFGQTWRSLIVTERLETWTSATRQSEPLTGIRSIVANLLLHPVPVPADAAEVLGPVLWLCDALSTGGASLTETGNLGRAFVHLVARESGWWKGLTLPRTELEFYELHTLHALLRTARLAQHEHGRFMLNVPGISSRMNVDDTWARVARSIAGSDDFAQAAFETVMCILLTATGDASWVDVLDTATTALAGYGWEQSVRGSSGRELVTGRSVEHATGIGIGRLRLLGGVRRDGNPGERTVTLTDGGRALALTYIRERAAGPRHATTT